ncbi:MAG: hypothetical protein AB7F98_10960, partial [Novosphingobium sp.]
QVDIPRIAARYGKTALAGARIPFEQALAAAASKERAIDEMLPLAFAQICFGFTHDAAFFPAG